MEGLQKQKKKCFSVQRWIQWFAVLVAVVYPSIAFVPPYRVSSTPRKTIDFIRAPIFMSKQLLPTVSADNNKGTRKSKLRKPRSQRSRWEPMMAQLRAFYDVHGHSNVTFEYAEKYAELAKWVQTIRYRHGHQVKSSSAPTTKGRWLLSDEKIQQLEDLQFSWETSRKYNRFDDMLQRLRDFSAKHGHVRVPSPNTTEQQPTNDTSTQLYEWTKYIRNTYRHQALNQTLPNSTRSRLAQSKLEALQEVGFDWEPERRVGRWEDLFPRLTAYHAKYGHANVSSSDGDAELFQWTQSLLANYGIQLRNETKSTSCSSRHKLPQEKVQALQQLGFGGKQSPWKKSYGELKEFYHEHGHSRPRKKTHRKLAVFVENQRQAYRRFMAGNSTTLTNERIVALEDINFDWGRSHSDLWQQRLEELEEFRNRTGHSHVPQGYARNRALGFWCMNQRAFHRQNERAATDAPVNGLTQERYEALEQLDFIWNYRDSLWNSMLQRLEEYQRMHGHIEIDTDDMMNTDLRQWLNEQRHFYKTNRRYRLSINRIAALEGIDGFSWRRRQGRGPSKEDWSDLFVAIREKGISPTGKLKQHWFEGLNPLKTQVKTEWTEQELLALWNEEQDEDKDEEDYFYEAEEGDDEEEERRFLQA